MSIVAAIGNVARDPYITKDEQGEASFARFTLVEDNWTGGRKIVTFIDCIGFGPIAKIVEKIIEKGKLCYIEGNLMSGSYTKNGQTIHTRNVRVSKIRVYRQGTAQGDPSLELIEEEDVSEDEYAFGNDSLSWDTV